MLWIKLCERSDDEVILYYGFDCAQRQFQLIKKLRCNNTRSCASQTRNSSDKVHNFIGTNQRTQGRRHSTTKAKPTVQPNQTQPNKILGETENQIKPSIHKQKSKSQPIPVQNQILTLAKSKPTPAQNLSHKQLTVGVDQVQITEKERRFEEIKYKSQLKFSRVNKPGV